MSTPLISMSTLSASMHQKHRAEHVYAAELVRELGVQGAALAIADTCAAQAETLDSEGQPEGAALVREAEVIYRQAAASLEDVVRKGWHLVLTNKLAALPKPPQRRAKCARASRSRS